MLTEWQSRLSEERSKGIVKLDNRRTFTEDEFTCELTLKLDSLAKLTDEEFYDVFHHYILADKWCKKEKCLAIRVPGGTVGGIWLDDNNIITKIDIDVDYVVKTYPSNVNDIIQKFVGEVVEY